MKKSTIVYALQLALLSILVMLIQSQLDFSKLGFVGKVIPPILWAIKFFGSIWLLYFFIREISKNSEEFSYKQGLRVGVVITLISSLVCAAFQFFTITLLQPDLFTEQLAVALETLEQSNPDAASNLEDVLPHIPTITLIFGFIYYWILGIIASSIIANYTKKEPTLFEQNNQ